MTIREAIWQIVKDHFATNMARVAKVLEVDSEAATCTVETLDTETTLYEVRLQASPGNGMLLIPAVDSFVVVDALNETDYVVVMFSALDSIRMLDGSYGGLVKVQTLKEELDKTNAVVQAILDAFSNWTPVAQDGGAALKTAFSSSVAGKTLGDFSDIENDKITHGEV